MTQRDAVFPPNRHALYEAHGYSAAIRSGDLLFVSGRSAAVKMDLLNRNLKRRCDRPLPTCAPHSPPEDARLTTLLMSPHFIPIRKISSTR